MEKRAREKEIYKKRVREKTNKLLNKIEISILDTIKHMIDVPYSQQGVLLCVCVSVRVYMLCTYLSNWYWRSFNVSICRIILAS